MLLLDTNVLSELRKVRTGRADRNVARWAQTLDTATLYVSVVSIQELETGILAKTRQDPTQGAILRAWLETRVLPSFQGRILPIDTAVARMAARLHVPDPKPLADSYIAATALVHGLTVATRNTADFLGMNVPLVDPWSAQV